jgi:hypothetical protein
MNSHVWGKISLHFFGLFLHIIFITGLKSFVSDYFRVPGGDDVFCGEFKVRLKFTAHY